MKLYSSIAWLIGVIICGYILYAWWQAKGVPATIDIGSAINFKSIPATTCRVGNDAHTVTGTLYVFHAAARFDITSITTGTPINIHIIVSPEDSAFVWQDGNMTGANFDYNHLYHSLHLEELTRVLCTPWWIPGGGPFVVPNDVIIQR